MKRVIEECLIKKIKILYAYELDKEQTDRSKYNTYWHWVPCGEIITYHKGELVENRTIFGKSVKPRPVAEIEEDTFNKLKETLTVYIVHVRD